jgi:biopolymer transport protein ExbB
LMVGVPAFIFYAYLVTRARHLMHDMERAGIEMVNLIGDARDAGLLTPTDEAAEEA